MRLSTLVEGTMKADVRTDVPMLGATRILELQGLGLAVYYLVLALPPARLALSNTRAVPEFLWKLNRSPGLKFPCPMYTPHCVQRQPGTHSTVIEPS
jgi:hypothetical protein